MEVEEHIGWLTNKAIGLCDGNVDEADDLVQKTLIRAWEKEEQCRENAAGWLGTILLRIFLDEKRKKQVIETVELKEWHYSELPPTPEESFNEAERVKEIEGALAALPPIYREVMELKINGETEMAIADTLNIAVGTVKSRASRAREILAKTLEA